MNTVGLSLRDIEYVVAVADLRHFGKAAERCAVSQPSLSAQIRKLEDFLGVTLFERTSRRVLPTPQGEPLIRQGRIILAEARRLLDMARGQDGTLTGTLMLGAIQTLGPYLFPHILAPLRGLLPDLELVLSEGRTDGLLEELREGRIDAVLLSPPVAMDGLTVEPLYFEPFLLAHPTNHPLAAQNHVTLDDVASDELLLLEEGHCLRDQSLAVCGLSARGMRHATGLETLRHMVAAGGGVTLMPALAAGQGTEMGGLIRYRPLDDPETGRTVALAWRNSDPRSNGFHELAAFLKKHRPGVLAAATGGMEKPAIL